MGASAEGANLHRRVTYVSHNSSGNLAILDAMRSASAGWNKRSGIALTNFFSLGRCGGETWYGVLSSIGENDRGAFFKLTSSSGNCHERS